MGVDTAFAFSASMVQQARLWLQSRRWQGFQETLDDWEIPVNAPMTAEQAYFLITRAGALALRRPDLGVIEVGAKADLVVYRTDNPNMLGISDPVAAIILHFDVGDIDDVLVGGKFVKRKGRLVHENYGDVARRFKASASRIQDIYLNEIGFPPLEGNWNSGAPYGTTRRSNVQRRDGSNV